MRTALVKGRLPEASGEILISDEFASKLEVVPGGTITLLSSTMYGSMALQNFTIAGTLVFGINAMDKGAIILDIKDAQSALDMENGTGEILGYFPNNIYNDKKAENISKQFNTNHTQTDDEFSPVMQILKEQNDLASMIEYTSEISRVVIFVFILAMSIVLWNAGLIGGLRRYGEVGLRLAIGEVKGRIYRSMLAESVLIGICGTVIGTLIGLGFAYILQTKGINVGSMMKNSTMMLPNIYRAQITSKALYIGIIPGLFSTVLGTMLAGIGIYRRKTAQLFKELEV